MGHATCIGALGDMTPRLLQSHDPSVIAQFDLARRYCFGGGAPGSSDLRRTLWIMGIGTKILRSIRSTPGRRHPGHSCTVQYLHHTPSTTPHPKLNHWSTRALRGLHHSFTSLPWSSLSACSARKYVDVVPDNADRTREKPSTVIAAVDSVSASPCFVGAWMAGPLEFKHSAKNIK